VLFLIFLPKYSRYSYFNTIAKKINLNIKKTLVLAYFMQKLTSEASYEYVVKIIFEALLTQDFL
jgi:uncharacterized protein YeeX (DUF496 family)